MIRISSVFRFLRCFLMLAPLMPALLSACLKSPSAPAVQEPAFITLSSYSIVLTAIGQRVLINTTVLDQDSRVISDETIFFKTGAGTFDRQGSANRILQRDGWPRLDEPEGLDQLAYLIELHLDHNALSGVIPADLGLVNSLERLSLEDNDLTGSIPVELGQPSNLGILNWHS